MHLLTLMACTTEVTIDTVDTATSIESSNAEFAIRWGTESIEVDILYGDAGVWWFGLAETVGEQPWTGEDCFQGGALENGQSVVWCHPISLQGGVLRYGGNPMSLTVGEETAMSLESLSKKPMFYFLNVIDNQCAIGGEGAPSYPDLCDNRVQIAVEEPTQ